MPHIAQLAFWTLPILFTLYMCYHAPAYQETHQRHRAKQLTRDELGEEILYTHAMNGNWQVFYAEWCERGCGEYVL